MGSQGCSPLSASSTKVCELTHVQIMVSTLEWFDVPPGCGKDVCCHREFSLSLSAVTHSMLVRFTDRPEILRDLAHLEDDLEEGGVRVSADSRTCVRRVVWGMLYTDDAELCLIRRKALPRW